MHRRFGFTLIELVIAVAIIGLLASIAIPSFVRFQLRSNSTEAVVNLAAIGKSQTTFFSEFGDYVSVDPIPPVLPGSVRAPWPGASGFDVLGWRPEGQVLFQYRVTTSSAQPPRFTAEATSDLDNDLAQSFYAYIKPGPGVGGLDGAFGGSTCVGSGVYEPSTGSASSYGTAGPCDNASGRSRF